jgi:tetratricopeptide (TPR) repeat protein
MKKTLLFLLLFCLSKTIFSQSDITITGSIIDKETKQPLPYVNIGFIEKAIGTVSDEQGKFWLTFNADKVEFDAILQISSLGYETIKLKASKFYSSINKNNKIYLKPKPFSLEEVVISNEKWREKRVGTLKIKENSIGYWLNKEALGGEIATKVNIKNKNSRLLDLKFIIVKNNSGSIKIRVNIYEYHDGMPGKNLLKKNIYHTIYKPFGEEVIDLKPYNIVVSNTVVVSIELIKVYGSYIDFEVAASRFNGTSFTRHLSHDIWKRYDNLMAFSLGTSYPVKKDPNKDVVRELPKKITLYWDTSLAMKDRKLKEETTLIKKYLNKLKNVEVEIIKFSTKPQEPKLFSIKKGKSDALIQYLKSSTYNGATNYSQILKENTFGAETILVFTDGNENFEALKQLVYVPTFYINSSVMANHFSLQREASYADGHYINLSKIDISKGLQLMLNEVEDEGLYESVSHKSKGNIYGKIISDSLKIHGATIRIKNSLKEVISDAEGNYSINAREGDIMVVNAFGMFTKEIPILKSENIDISLKPEGELLEEVLLKGVAKKEERIINTPYGQKNFDAVGFAFDELKKEEISPAIHTLDQVIAKILGVLILGVGTDKRYMFARNLGSSANFQAAPIIIIDGMIYSQLRGLGQLPPIDMQTIESVKALKSAIATNRYGSAAQFGAIVIKTQATSYNSIKVTDKKPSALITDNNYTEELPLVINNYKKPNYITQLEQSSSYKNAKSIYNAQLNKASQLSIPFFINVSHYFERWNKDYAHNILSNIAEIGKDNPKALKALAYNFEEQGNLNEAKQIYQRIAAQRNKDAQSYRDLALIYQETGNYTKAMDLYKQMLSNSIVDVDFSGLYETIINELKHLIALHENEVDYKDLPEDLIKANFKNDIRIVFNWNDPNTEFEVQFVNPKKKFFTWQQTKLDNSERMLDGITKGYHTEEFIIDEDEVGEWLINIESLNEEPQLNPTYLKYTVYKNYGLANETKITKVLNLNTAQSKVTLDKLLYR